MINQTADSENKISDSLLTVNDIFVSTTYADKLSFIEPLYYGMVGILTIFFLLMIICFSFCDKLWCKTFLNIMGFLLFLLCLFSFCLLLVLSFISPIFYSGCKYIKNSINDPDKFTGNNQHIKII